MNSSSFREISTFLYVFAIKLDTVIKYFSLLKFVSFSQGGKKNWQIFNKEYLLSLFNYHTQHRTNLLHFSCPFHDESFNGQLKTLACIWVSIWVINNDLSKCITLQMFSMFKTSFIKPNEIETWYWILHLYNILQKFYFTIALKAGRLSPYSYWVLSV